MHYNIKIEEALLCCLLQSNETWQQVCGKITEKDFYKDSNKKLFCVIESLLSQNKNCDVLLAISALKDSDEKIGQDFIHMYANQVFSTKSINAYIEQLKKLSDLRLTEKSKSKISDLNCETAQDFVNQISEINNDLQNKIYVAPQKTTTDLMQEILLEIENKRDNNFSQSCVSSGFKNLDELITGFYPANLIILGARAGMGKSMLAINIASNIVRNTDNNVVIFSLEMDSKQLLIRNLSATSEIKSEKIIKGDLSNEDVLKVSESIPKMKFEKLLIFDKPKTTVQEMKNICVGLQKEKKISFVIVDHLSLITETKKSENETVRISNIARDLKILAKELNVPVFVLCQLNRMVDSRTDKRPTLSDLKSSGGIEENADLVLFIYRDDYYDHNKKTNVAEIIVRKNRNGKEGSTRFITNFEICRFEDCDFRNEPKIMPMPKRKFYPNGTPNYREIYEN